MKWILWTFIALAGVVGVIALVGYFLPVSHEASRNAEFNKPPDAVFALLSDVNNYRSWWDGAEVKSVVVESVPPTRIVTKVVEETQFGGTWTIDIAPVPTGSRVTITERGEVYNVIFRALSKFVFGHTSTMDSCLAAVGKVLA